MRRNSVFMMGMLAVLAFSLVLAGCPMDPDTDEKVTGGHTVTGITPNTWYEGELSANEEMWVKFTAGDDTKYFHFSPGLLTGISIQMFNSKNEEQGNSISLGYYSPEETALNVRSGDTYYIRITGRGSGSGTLKFGLTGYVDVSPYEMNRMVSATLVSSTNWLQTDMSANGSHWFKFTAASSTTYVHFKAGGLTGISVQVRKKTGEKSGNSKNLGYYSETTTSLALLSGNEYYLEVWPRGSGSGTYSLKVSTSLTP
jgi:hypothetical protein